MLLWVTGDGDMRRGSGSFSVFWAIVSALIILITMIKLHRLMSFSCIFKQAIQGMKHMSPAVAILVLSFAFGDAIKALGTGVYVSQLLNVEVSQTFIAPIFFLAAALLAFATGPSWGSFALLIPLAVPIAQK